ncbi:hypothetical protein CARUB_v10025106mg [Capsella rubella]|uniref:Cystatin domain-containing protein n=1 Tax=Capsella rubella TaxID=81985 RepID=R0G0C8_9BRAS|nr:uncharacterized protein LOC17889480 [Capsella rubella]EOA28862.1 hypothetical protein CARUB_v10025106mg [Capsella rubella]
MDHDFPDWRTIVHPVHLRYKDEDEDGPRFYPHIRRSADEEKISAEEEYRIMVAQVKESKGFDIDFTKFRCVFNYEPLDLDDEDMVGGPGGPETTREFIDRMCRESLEIFNETNSTEYEFVKFIKANHHFAAGIMFLVTFQGKLLSDDVSKQFQAKFCLCASLVDFFSCELRPLKKQGNSIPSQLSLN